MTAIAPAVVTGVEPSRFVITVAICYTYVMGYLLIYFGLAIFGLLFLGFVCYCGSDEFDKSNK
jgi:hypothetical protein